MQSENNSVLCVTALGVARFKEIKLKVLCMKNISGIENMKWHSHALVHHAVSQQRVGKNKRKPGLEQHFDFWCHVVSKEPAANVQVLIKILSMTQFLYLYFLFKCDKKTGSHLYKCKNVQSKFLCRFSTHLPLPLELSCECSRSVSWGSFARLKKWTTHSVAVGREWRLCRVWNSWNCGSLNW